MQIMEALRELGCNIHMEVDGTGMPKMGFPNSHASRMQGVTALRQSILDGDFRAYDEALVMEILQYQKVVNSRTGNEEYGAPTGLHDDLCVAAQRACQMRAAAPMTRGSYASAASQDNVVMLPTGRW